MIKQQKKKFKEKEAYEIWLPKMMQSKGEAESRMGLQQESMAKEEEEEQQQQLRARKSNRVRRSVITDACRGNEGGDESFIIVGKRNKMVTWRI